MTNYNNSAEADILSKYQDVFPSEFIEAVKKGVSWLCTHNNITYQTSIMVASDRVIYNTAGSSVLRIGLINVNLPLTGLTYYEVKSIEVAKDEVSGNIIFNVKMKYDTPMGLSATLVPITYFDPESNKEYCTKAEINALINSLQTSLDSKADSEVVENAFSAIDVKLENLDSNESLTKLENKVDDMLQSLALDFVTNEKLEEELAKLESGDKELDLTSYLKVKDAEATYLKIADITTKPELVGPAGKDGKDGTSVTIDEVKPVIIEALKADNEFKQEVKGIDGTPGKDGVSPTPEEVANVLKDNEEFKVSVKGEQGEQGIPGTSANKDEVIAALKADDTFKAEVKGEKGDTGSEGPQGPKGDNGEPGKDGVSPSAQDVATAVKDEVVTALTTNEEFKAAVKGEKGDTGPEADTSTLATKTELADKLDTSTYNTDKAEFVTNTSLATTLGDYLTSAAADEKYEPKASE